MIYLTLPPKDCLNWRFVLAVIVFTLFATLIYQVVWGQDLTASWYSIESLKKEGTYKYSKGIMANGRIFNNDYTCATNLYPLGAILRVYNPKNGKEVSVEVTDRINKRFTKTRIDLSQKAFSEIAECRQGIVRVKVEYIGNGWI